VPSSVLDKERLAEIVAARSYRLEEVALYQNDPEA